MADKLTFEVLVEDKATADLKKIQKEVQSLTDRLNKNSSTAGVSGSSFGKLAGAIGVGTIAAKAFTMAVNETINFLKGSIDAVNSYQSAMIGLSSVAAAFGENQKEARDSAQALAKDGLMSVTEAGEGLKNLLASGFNLEESINLMNGFKDSAAFNRQGTLEFGQAIVGATQGIKNQNSIMVDNVGITKNLTMILKEQGLAVTDLQYVTTDAGVRQKLYNGLLQEASIFSGDAGRAAETLQGQQSALHTSTYMLMKTVGEMLTPAMMVLTGTMIDATMSAQDMLIPVMEKVGSAFVIAAEIGLGFASVIKNVAVTTVQAAWNIGKAMTSLMRLDLGGVSDAFSAVVDNVKSGVEQGNKELKSIAERGQSALDKIAVGGLGGFADVAKKAMDKTGNAVSKGAEKIAKELERLAEKFKDIQEKIVKETASFARKMGDATADFQRSLTDLVLKHRDAIKGLRDDIAELNAEFAEGGEERLATHNDRVSEINKKYEEETETLRDNLNRRLADSHNSDEQLIAFFEKQIAEKEKLKDEELREEDKNYTEEEIKAKKAYEKSFGLLTEKLNAELAIQQKHQADFDALKDQAVEDDITRLKNSFVREMEELKRQHDERMEELRKEQEEILALKAATEAKTASSITSSSKSRTVSVTKPTTTQSTKSNAVDRSNATMAGVVINQTNNNYSQVDYNSKLIQLGWALTA